MKNGYVFFLSELFFRGNFLSELKGVTHRNLDSSSPSPKPQQGLAQLKRSQPTFLLSLPPRTSRNSSHDEKRKILPFFVVHTVKAVKAFGRVEASRAVWTVLTGRLPPHTTPRLMHTIKNGYVGS